MKREINTSVCTGDEINGVRHFVVVIVAKESDFGLGIYGMALLYEVCELDKDES
jgi:hypothetical protein